MNDPFAQPYPYYFHETTIDKLVSIFEYGILAKNTATKFKLTHYKQNFNSSWNTDYVSLANSPARTVAAPEVALLIKPEGLPITTPNFNNGDLNRPIEFEVLVIRYYSGTEYSRHCNW